MLSARVFDPNQLEALARALVEPPGGLTHNELANLLAQRRLPNLPEDGPKWRRLFNTLAQNQNTLNSNKVVLQFVEYAAAPVRFINRRDEYEMFRESVNRPLAFVGRAITEEGQIIEVKSARTLSEAERRARELRSDLKARGVHPDVLHFCKAELLADNYFHAVLEATKSIAQKMRDRTGLHDDGSVLIDHVFGGDMPLLVINAYETKNDRKEQAGFCNLLKGVFGMFRNTTAHAPRILWPMSKEDAEDLLSLVSLIHRRIGQARMPPRV